MTKFKFLLLLLAICLGPLAIFAAEDSAPRMAAPDAAVYQIRNVMYGDLLRPKDANNAEGTPIVLYPAQPWKCMTWRLQPTNEGSPSGDSAFHVKNLFTSKTFRAELDTNAPQQYVTQLRLPKNNSEAPAWRFTILPDGNCQITDTKSGNALTAIKNGGASETRIVTAHWQNLDSQKWRLEKIDPKDLTM